MLRVRYSRFSSMQDKTNANSYWQCRWVTTRFRAAFRGKFAKFKTNQKITLFPYVVFVEKQI